jgi:hypothetical protein
MHLIFAIFYDSHPVVFWYNDTIRLFSSSTIWSDCLIYLKVLDYMFRFIRKHHQVSYNYSLQMNVCLHYGIPYCLQWYWNTVKIIKSGRITWIGFNISLLFHNRKYKTKLNKEHLLYDFMLCYSVWSPYISDSWPISMYILFMYSDRTSEITSTSYYMKDNCVY